MRRMFKKKKIMAVRFVFCATRKRPKCLKLDIEIDPDCTDAIEYWKILCLSIPNFDTLYWKQNHSIVKHAAVLESHRSGQPVLTGHGSGYFKQHSGNTTCGSSTVCGEENQCGRFVITCSPAIMMFSPLSWVFNSFSPFVIVVDLVGVDVNCLFIRLSGR